jgi:hypothetical protein
LRRIDLIVSAVMRPSLRSAGLESSVPMKIIVGRPAIFFGGLCVGVFWLVEFGVGLAEMRSWHYQRSQAITPYHAPQQHHHHRPQ